VDTAERWHDRPGDDRAAVGARREGRDVSVEDLIELRGSRHRARVADAMVLQLSVLVWLARVGPVTAGVWGRAKVDQLTQAGLSKRTVLDAKTPRLGGTEGGVVRHAKSASRAGYVLRTADRKVLA